MRIRFLHFPFKIYLLQTYNALDRSHFGCLSTKPDQDHECCHLLIPINSFPRFYVSNVAFCEGISMSFLWRVCVSLSLYHFILHVSFNEKMSRLEKENSFIRTFCIYQTIVLSCMYYLDLSTMLPMPTSNFTLSLYLTFFSSI